MFHAIPLTHNARVFRTAAALTVAMISTTALDAAAATRTVGPGKAYPTPCSAFAAAANGDLIEISAGTYTGDVCSIKANNLTVRSVNGRAKIDAGGQNALGKGIWVVDGNDVTIENVEMYGARVADQNGAALRLEGINFTLRSSFLHDNENGILANPNIDSNILIETSEFGHNGTGAGNTHNLYIGNVGNLTFRYNYSHDANVGHNLKSRAVINTVSYNRFSSTPPGQSGTTASGQPSYELDFPNGGTTYVIGNVIEQPSINQNPTMLAYGEEGVSNPKQDLYVVNNTFINDDSSHGTFLQIGGDVTTPVLMQNNIFAGVGTPSTQASAIDKTNYRSLAPAFTNRAAYDLTPASGAAFINAGSAVGNSVSGVSLTPVAQYHHPVSSDPRAAVGAIDIGAYEAGPSAAPVQAKATGPALAPAGAWSTCAAEHGNCTFSGTRQVRYGAGGSYVTRDATGSIACNNGVFGDPAYGVVKSCSYSSVTR